MKRLFTYLTLITIFGNLSAEIAVKSFRKLESDMTARIDAPKKDQNGDVCAIIKVVTTQTGFTWEPDGLGIKEVVKNGAEYWLYVPHAAKRLTINHPQLGLLRDYVYPLPIEKACVYEMVLVSGRVENTVVEEINSQWLLIKSNVPNSVFYINDQWKKNGNEYQTKLKYGKYTYRVEAPMYHSEAGSVELTNTKKELSINLKPAFGFIDISTSPEQGAAIMIDGKPLSQTTPYKTEPIVSGEHTLQVMKELYEPVQQKVIVADGQITAVNIKLNPNFSELRIQTDKDAIIYLNNSEKAKGQWQGRLNAGVYSIEVRSENHKPIRQDIELLVGDKKDISLMPMPIYGSLDISTEPSGASIMINGINYGTTPNTIDKLLTGNYNLEITKSGFNPIKKNILISSDKITELSETLERSVEAPNNLNKQKIIDLELKVALSPKDTASWNSLIDLYVETQDTIKIEDVMKRAIEAVPTVSKWLITMCYIRAQQGRGVEALSFCNKAFQYVDLETSTEVKSVVYYYYASFQYANGNKDEAFKSFELGYKYDNNNLQLLNDFAFYLMIDRKDYLRALQMSLKTIQSEPKNSQYLDTYAWILFLSGDFKTAYQYIKLAIENLPVSENNGIYYDHYGDILWFNGNRTDAVVMWQKAINEGYKTVTLEKKVSTKSYIN